MRTAPFTIPEVGYPLQVDVNVWTGRRRLFAGAHEVPTYFGRFELVGGSGRRVAGLIRPLRIWQTHPRIEVDGTVHRTGPEAPAPMKALAFLPLLLLFIGGLPGASLGVAGVLVNFVVIRSTGSRRVAVATCIGTLLLGAVVLFAIAGIVGAAQAR